MLDVPLPKLQRTRGKAAVRLSHDSATRLERLRQEGAAKVFLPRSHGLHPEIVFLNTAGGLTGGDALRYALTLGAGGAATATTQTAERIYRSGGRETARVDVVLKVGEAARLDWVPQETILFDGAALERATDVHLGAGSTFLMVETVVLGRSAMGERVSSLDFKDRRRVFREERPVFVEPLHLDNQSVVGNGTAELNGARALATVALFAQGAEDALTRVRRCIQTTDVAAHASGWDGKVVMRAMAPEARPLRQLVVAVVSALRGGDMPRVWQV
ncbi:MAG: urease accessory protein UreD [Pseudomonadota bacterium]